MLRILLCRYRIFRCSKQQQERITSVSYTHLDVYKRQEILGPVGSWTKIKSGDVTGYVCSDYIIIGNNAEQKAQEIVEEKQEEFVYAESREAEEERLAKEAEEKVKEAEAKAGTGQAIVDYACQFIGNPYVWGGTSLTNGCLLYTSRCV